MDNYSIGFISSSFSSSTIKSSLKGSKASLLITLQVWRSILSLGNAYNFISFEKTCDKSYPKNHTLFWNVKSAEPILKCESITFETGLRVILVFRFSKLIRKAFWFAKLTNCTCLRLKSIWGIRPRGLIFNICILWKMSTSRTNPAWRTIYVLF